MSLDQLVLEAGAEVAQQVVHCPRDRVDSSQDGAEVHEEVGEVFLPGLYLHAEASDGVVEVDHGGLVSRGVGVLLVGVLVGVVAADGALVVPGGNDVDVVVERAVPDRTMPLQDVQRRLRVLPLYARQVVLSPEVELVDYMACVQAFDQSLCLDLHVVVEVGVAADVEVPGHLLDCKGADEPAAVLVLDCLSHCFQLLEGVLLSEELIASPIEVGAIAMEPPLLDRADVGVVGDHDVLEVETNELAGEGGELDVDVDAE